MLARNLIALSFFMVALAVGYYFVIFLPGKVEKEGLERVWEQTQKSAEEEKMKQAYSDCQDLAGKEANATLKSKAKLVGDPVLIKAAEQGMFYKDDYEETYKQCLRQRGINP